MKKIIAICFIATIVFAISCKKKSEPEPTPDPEPTPTPITFKCITAHYFGIFDNQNWNNSDVPFEKCNRIYIAFAWVRNGELDTLNYGDDLRINTLVSKIHSVNPNAEILICSGYDNGSMYIQAALDTSKFAQSVLAFCQKYNLDGLDMDWENGINTDKMYNLLLATRNTFTKAGNNPHGKPYKLTIAVWPSSISSHYNNAAVFFPKAALVLDQINIMSYGRNFNMANSITAYSYLGFPKDKMIGGVESENGYGEYGGHDTDSTTNIKCQYALTNNMAGMMSWRLDNDMYDFDNNKWTFSCAEWMYKYLKN